MLVNHAVENALGTIGTVCWTGQIIPQIWKSYREKSTMGLSGMLMFLWATSAVFLGVYNIVQNLNIPLILQPQLFGFLAALSWTQCLYYGQKWPLKRCIFILVVYSMVFAGFEAGMTFAIRAIENHGNHRPLDFFGIFSAVLISVGLIPQYIEIYRLQEVVGISMVFMTIDIAGGIFSLLSLVFRETFDVVASITYIAVIVLDAVVVILAIILNPRAKRRREQKAQSHIPPPDMTEKGPAPTLTPSLDLERGLSPKTIQGDPIAGEDFNPTITSATQTLCPSTRHSHEHHEMGSADLEVAGERQN